MAVLNSGVTVTVSPAAGVGAAAQLVAVNQEGLRGLLRIDIGTGPTAGLLAVVHLASPVVADMDAYVVAVLGGVNGGAFGGVEILLTPFPPLPPAGAVIYPAAQLSQGQVPAFGIAASAPLTAATIYRFSWRVLV
jgi:hypothetical protein